MVQTRLEELERLARLREGGALSQEEFDSEKAAIFEAPPQLTSQSRRKRRVALGVVTALLLIVGAAWFGLGGSRIIFPEHRVNISQERSAFESSEEVKDEVPAVVTEPIVSKYVEVQTTHNGGRYISNDRNQQDNLAPIDVIADSEYWRNPAFYIRLRNCAGRDFNGERSNYRAFSDALHRCYAQITNDPTYNYYVQAKVETCYRRQYHAECRVRGR